MIDMERENDFIVEVLRHSPHLDVGHGLLSIQSIRLERQASQDLFAVIVRLVQLGLEALDAGPC